MVANTFLLRFFNHAHTSKIGMIPTMGTSGSRCCVSSGALCRRFSSSAGGSSSSAPSPIDVARGPVNAFQMNQYAVACTATRRAALIDCGASTPSKFDSFESWLTERGYELDVILQTHAHLDHVAGLGLARRVHPGIPILLHERERAIYEGFETSVARWNFDVSSPIPEDVTYFDDDRAPVAVGNLKFDIIPTPGHSPGHVGYYERKTKSFFGGDLIMQGSIGRTDFPTSDPGKMMESLRKILEMDEGTIIYPVHGQPTLLRHEKEYNPFLKELI